jgi:5-formyltetrahydrofolate cyclo-ligase
MSKKIMLRNRVWAHLRSVSFPDSRFHWDFSAFIPDFEGSVRCAEAIRSSTHYKEAVCVFVTPDNSLTRLRQSCISDQKPMIVPTYGIQRGFWQILPNDVPSGQEAFAATLDGLEYYGQPYSLTARTKNLRPEVLITGASILNREGIRISDTPSYFDLEWLIMDALGLVSTDIPILACVHDCQVIDLDTQPTPFGVVVDQIYTPSNIIEIDRSYARPSEKAWPHIPWPIVQDIPILSDIYQQRYNR